MTSICTVKHRQLIYVEMSSSMRPYKWSDALALACYATMMMMMMMMMMFAYVIVL